MHESLIILLIAAPFAYFLPILMTDNEQERESYKISPKISPDIIFNYLLPPIIMSAGFNMRKKFFFKNLGYIGLFGFVGTVINFMIVTTLIYWVNSMIGIEPLHYNKYSRLTQLGHHHHHVSLRHAHRHRHHRAAHAHRPQGIPDSLQRDIRRRRLQRRGESADHECGARFQRFQ